MTEKQKTPEEMLFWQSHYITQLVGGIFGILQAQGIPEEIIEELKQGAKVYADQELDKLDPS
jgi:hypothetical protein